MRASGIAARLWIPAVFLAGVLVGVHWAQRPRDAGLDRSTVQKFVTRHCTSCHSGDAKKAGLDLDDLGAEGVAAHPEAWEKVARKLAARQMPPAGRPRPDEGAYESFVAALEAELDRVAVA